jgi:CheY-like chemotaxis protein
MSLHRILVVEDESIVALDLRQRLEQMGFEVIATVATGSAALEQATSKNPDLILMDIQIKGEIDGIETASRITKLVDVPIIFLTANSDRSTIDRAKSAGPLAYLLKPF